MLLRFVISLIFMLLILPMIVQAKEVRASCCMTKHMQDAIQINRERSPFYQALSNGESRKITRLLIGMEKKLLLVSPLADFWARPYQRAGIPVVCEDIIDMSLTPKFREWNPEGRVSQDSYRPVLVTLAKNKLQELLGREDFHGLAWLSDQYVQQIEAQPRFNCLVRHMLESIRRAAILAPRYEVMARIKGVRSPRFLSKVLLKSHLNLLEESGRIDRLAAPLQASGIMIICQDVPAIPKPL